MAGGSSLTHWQSTSDSSNEEWWRPEKQYCCLLFGQTFQTAQHFVSGNICWAGSICEHSKCTEQGRQKMHLQPKDKWPSLVM